MTVADDETHADAQAQHEAPRVRRLSPARGLSPADAIAVIIVAALIAAFLDAGTVSGLLLIASIPAIYVVFRITRGWPLMRRALAMVAVFVGAIVVSGVLVQLRD